jgi:hypothetical protein
VAWTAWRCDRDGTRLTLTLAEDTEISRVSVVPGFAKTDPYAGTDRYAQGRRVRRRIAVAELAIGR